MCDTEFTIEQGKLWMLQTRVGKRTGAAALAHGRRHDQATKTSKLTHEEAVQRVTGRAPRAGAAPPVRGRPTLPSSPRAWPPRPAPPSASAYFTADDAADAAERGEKVVLVRTETSPEDVHGMIVAEGILTSRGGLVSHAAVVARGWGKPAVVGAESVADRRQVASPPAASPSTRATSSPIDGTTGEVVLGGVGAHQSASRPPEFTTILSWADASPRGQAAVRANADTGPDAAKARQFGAEGIGLCRTEHMFLGETGCRSCGA